MCINIRVYIYVSVYVPLEGPAVINSFRVALSQYFIPLAAAAAATAPVPTAAV